jgi:hypothetical protein
MNQLSPDQQALIEAQYAAAYDRLTATMYRIIYGVSAKWPPNAPRADAIREMASLDVELRAVAYGLPEPPEGMPEPPRM